MTNFIDVAKTAGFNVKINIGKMTLFVGSEEFFPTIRRVKDMTEVMIDRPWLNNEADMGKELYYMFRGISLLEDEKTIKESKLRYDITIIPPFMLGREFVKTAGHYHPDVPGTDITYTEVYEVLYGKALYLMQKVIGNKVIDAYFVEANAGDKVIIPPGYGHITINRSDEPLVMANWVASNFSSDYEPLKLTRGGCFFVLKDKILKNENYDNVPEPEFRKPATVLGGEPMYKLVGNTEKLEFLTAPQNHRDIFI